MDTYEIQVVVDDNNRPLMENQVLVFNEAGGKIQYLKSNKLENLLYGCQFVPQHFSQEQEENNFQLDETMTAKEASEKFHWSHASTLLLIDEYKKVYHKFHDPKIKKKQLWDTISKTMQQRGYALDADMLDKKMRNMKKTYRTIVNNNKRNRTGMERISCPYFETFEDMFHDDSTVNLPTSVICSSKKVDIPLDDNNSSNPCASVSQLTPVPLLSPQSSVYEEARSLSAYSSYDGAPGKPSKMEKYRKRQLEIEEDKLEQLKKLCTAIEVSIEIQKEKLVLLKQLATSRQS